MIQRIIPGWKMLSLGIPLTTATAICVHRRTAHSAWSSNAWIRGPRANRQQATGDWAKIDLYGDQ